MFSPELAFESCGRNGRGALESTDRLRGETGGSMCFVFLRSFKPLGFDDVLRCGVVNLKAICCFLDCHLILIDHIDQLAALGGFNGIVASLALGERRGGVRKML